MEDNKSNETLKHEFINLAEQMRKCLIKCRSKILSKLTDKKFDGLEIKTCDNSRDSCGVNTPKNDRRLYVWITTYYKGKEYDINLFHSEVDYQSGNCHCQIGKIMFTKNYVKNKNYITSPNEILKSNGFWLTDKNTTILSFHSYKWTTPVLKDVDVKSLANGKWITVDDVLENELFLDKLVDSFIQFIIDDKDI